MESNAGQRREKVLPIQPEAKKRKQKNRRRDEFRGNITGFIDVARNDGDVIAYSETTYAGNAEDIVESNERPRPRRKTRTQDRNYEDNVIEGESESSDDDDHGGSVFYGEISGFVKEARGTGNAIAMKKVTYAGSRGNSWNNSRGANPVQRRVRSQPESEIMESRKIEANNFPKITERPHAPAWPDLQQFQGLNADLGEELKTASPEMQQFIASLAQQQQGYGPRSMDDQR